MNKQLEKYILENQHILEVAFIPVLAYGWVGHLIVATTGLIFGGAVIGVAIEKLGVPYAGLVADTWNDWYDSQFEEENGSQPKGQFKKEAWWMNKTKTAPKEYWSGWGDALNPWKNRWSKLQIEMFKDHPYIYWSNKKRKFKVNHSFAKAYRAAEVAMKEYGDLRNDKSRNPLYKIHKKWNPRGINVIDHLNKLYPGGFEDINAGERPELDAAAKRDFVKEFPWMAHNPKQGGWYCVTRFPWRWNATDRSQDYISHDILVAKFFQREEGRIDLYRKQTERDLPSSDTDARKNHDLIYLYLAYIGQEKAQENIGRRNDYAKRMLQHIKKYISRNKDLNFRYKFPDDGPSKVVPSAMPDVQYARYRADKAPPERSYATLDPKWVKKMEAEDRARAKKRIIRANKVKQNQDLRNFIEKIEDLKINGNENTKKVIKKIESNVASKNIPFSNKESPLTKREGVAIDKSIEEMEKLVDKIPDLIDYFDRIESGEPIEKSSSPIPKLGDKPLPGQSVPTIDEQAAKAGGVWNSRDPWLATDASGTTAEGSFNIVVALYVNEKQEAIFIEQDRSAAVVKIYDVKGNGIGWQDKQGVHLHPNAKGQLPPEVKIDYSFESDKNAKDIQALKAPARKSHEEETKVNKRAQRGQRRQAVSPAKKTSSTAKYKNYTIDSKEGEVILTIEADAAITGGKLEFLPNPQPETPQKVFIFVVKGITPPPNDGVAILGDKIYPGGPDISIHAGQQKYPGDMLVTISFKNEVDTDGLSLILQAAEKSAVNIDGSDKVSIFFPKIQDSTQNTSSKNVERPKKENEANARLEQAEKGKTLPFDKNNKIMARIQKRLLRSPKLRGDRLTLAKIQGNLINYFEPDPREKTTFENSNTAKKYFQQLDSKTVQEQKIPSFDVLGDGNYGDETKEAIKAFQRDMIKKGFLGPLKSSKKRKGFSNIDGLYGPNTHNNQYLEAMRKGKLRKRPKIDKKEEKAPVIVKSGSPQANNLIKKAKQADKKKGEKIDCGKFKKISFARWMAIMVANGCIYYDRKHGKNYIPAEKREQCRLCTNKMKSSDPVKKESVLEAYFSANLNLSNSYDSVLEEMHLDNFLKQCFDVLDIDS